MTIGPDKPKGISTHRVAVILAFVGSVMAVLAVLCWLTGRWEWLSLGTERVPIAPLTALLFVFLTTILLAELLWAKNSAVRRNGCSPLPSEKVA